MPAPQGGQPDGATGPPSSRDRAEARRDRLRSVMGELEHSLAEPISGPDWRRLVAVATDRLIEALGEHVGDTEGPGGFFAELTLAAPRLNRRIENLRRDHIELMKAAVHLRSVVEAEGDTEATIRRLGVALIADLAHHRHAGADLLYEAYWQDIGPAD